MSLSNRKIDMMKKDAKLAGQKYAKAAEKVISDAAKELFLAMSENESEHVNMLEKVKEHENDSSKKTFLGRFFKRKNGKEKDEDKIKDFFEREGVYQEQGAESEVSVDRPELPEENEWNEEYEDDKE